MAQLVHRQNDVSITYQEYKILCLIKDNNKLYTANNVHNHLNFKQRFLTDNSGINSGLNPR